MSEACSKISIGHGCNPTFVLTWRPRFFRLSSFRQSVDRILTFNFSFSLTLGSSASRGGLESDLLAFIFKLFFGLDCRSRSGSEITNWLFEKGLLVRGVGG